MMIDFEFGTQLQIQKMEAKMKKEVKLIKDYLRLCFPNNFFSVRYYTPNSYLSGGEGLIISTDLEYNSLFMCLREITEHIIIHPYRQGAMLRGGKFGRIFNEETDVEFISLKHKEE